jgi:cation transport ATPase
MINLNTVSQVKVTTAYTDSKLSKILELVQNATAQKAPQNYSSENLQKYIHQLLCY